MLSQKTIEFQQSLSLELIGLQSRLITILISNMQNPKVCIDLSNKIDEIIVLLAQHSLHSEPPESHYISELKEFNWSLLESLEEYCLKELQISIW